LTFCRDWGLLSVHGAEKQLALAHWSAGNDASAEHYWELAIGRDETDIESRLDLAASYLKRGEAGLAEPVLRAMVELQPRSAKDNAMFAHYRGNAWQYLGSIAAARGDAEGARAALYAALAEQPESAMLLTNLAVIESRSGDWDASVGLFRRAAAASPHDPAAWNNLGVALQSAGEPAEAESCFKRSWELSQAGVKKATTP
ncbi:MAG: tetratricopeptide repeat protein, partial [Phycisphaerales bacterium]|nr:tetratricopeptide repeat protein [Phycisphaerales bacterium]